MELRFNPKKYSHKELYTAMLYAFRSISDYRIARKKKLLSPDFSERIMLAVTRVNGCEACSYAHTKMALETGMSSREIYEILSGDVMQIPQDQAVAVSFAQHYADRKGEPSEKAWLYLTDNYSDQTASGILGAIRVMMAANIYGIAFSSILQRFKKKHTGSTTLIHELSIIIMGMIYLPVAFIHSLIWRIFKRPYKVFK